jgi:hypothetical protein
MEHTEARELLEIAAVEPEGFERLAAGDTPEAAALAGHLAGCPECAAEMDRLRRAAAVIRDAVRTIPPPDLRDRTLAFIAAVGRERDRAAAAPASSAPGQATVAGAGSGGRAVGLAVRPGRQGVYAVAMAAVIAIAVIGTAALLGRANDASTTRLTEDVESITKVASWTLRIDGQPDARRVNLTGVGDAGAGATGTLVFSASSGELVAFAHGLPEMPAGKEYRCWMEIGGRRTAIGQMFPGRGVAYWVGNVDALSTAEPGTRFGVSVVPAGGDPVAGEPVLVGEL